MTHTYLHIKVVPDAWVVLPVQLDVTVASMLRGMEALGLAYEKDVLLVDGEAAGRRARIRNLGIKPGVKLQIRGGSS